MPKCSRWTSMVVGLSTTVSCRSTPQPRYSRWSSCLSSDCTSPRNAVVPFSLSCRDFHFCRSSHVLGPLCCCFVLLFFKSRSFFFFSFMTHGQGRNTDREHWHLSSCRVTSSVWRSFLQRLRPFCRPLVVVPAQVSELLHESMHVTRRCA